MSELMDLIYAAETARDRLVQRVADLVAECAQTAAERDRLRAWGIDVLHAMDKVAPDAPRFEDLQDRWDEMEKTSGHVGRDRLAAENSGLLDELDATRAGRDRLARLVLEAFELAEEFVGEEIQAIVKEQSRRIGDDR